MGSHHHIDFYEVDGNREGDQFYWGEDIWRWSDQTFPMRFWEESVEYGGVSQVAGSKQTPLNIASMVHLCSPLSFMCKSVLSLGLDIQSPSPLPQTWDSRG